MWVFLGVMCHWYLASLEAFHHFLYFIFSTFISYCLILWTLWSLCPLISQFMAEGDHPVPSKVEFIANWDISLIAMTRLVRCALERHKFILIYNWVGLLSVQHVTITWINDDFKSIMALEFYNGCETDHIITLEPILTQFDDLYVTGISELISLRQSIMSPISWFRNL